MLHLHYLLCFYLFDGSLCTVLPFIGQKTKREGARLTAHKERNIITIHPCEMNTGSTPPGGIVAEVKSKRRRPAHTDPSTAPPTQTEAALRPAAHHGVIGPFLDDSDIGGRLEKRAGSFDHFFCKSFPVGRRPVPKPLVNSSNFCFLNAVTQAMCFVPCIAHACSLLSQENKLAPIMSAFGLFLQQRYWRTGTAALVAPRLPLTLFARVSSSGAAGQQEDAAEFLVVLLAQMEAEMNGVESKYLQGESTGGGGEGEHAVTASPSLSATKTKALKKASDEHGSAGWITVGKKKREKVVVRHDSGSAKSSAPGVPPPPSSSSPSSSSPVPAYSLFRQLLGGVMANALRGGRGTARSVTSVVYEPFSCLSLTVSFAARCTVEEALIRTLQPEVVQDEARGVEMQKTTQMEILPQTLVLGVRRWAVTAEGDIVKIDNQVLFGDPLASQQQQQTKEGAAVSTNLIIPQECCVHKLTQQQRRYRLTAVVCHRGDGTQRGHYVTYLINEDGATEEAARSKPSDGGAGGGQQPQPEVVLCNDSTVSRATLRQLEKECAYILFYSRAAQGGQAAH
jgi:ubiquitin carboxyl-terminal hydrolase 10